LRADNERRVQLPGHTRHVARPPDRYRCGDAER
jgi:hypothetical protein